MNDSQIYINSLATSSFRNVADQDYIAARICYKNGLMLQFAWMAHQAIEKYFKAILLYNKRSTKNLNHNLKKSLNRINSIENIALDFSDDVLKFISYIDDQGPNRYLEKQHYTRGMEIISLDKAVWQIRRYCKVINHTVKLSNGDEKNLMLNELDSIHKWLNSDKPHKFILVGGYLEKIINKPKHQQREGLIWANLYYGKKQKNYVKVPRNVTMVNPVHIRHPKYFNDIEKVVHFPKEIRNYFNELQATEESE